jgi:hypothetical protein
MEDAANRGNGRLMGSFGRVIFSILTTVLVILATFFAIRLLNGMDMLSVRGP